MTHKFRSEMRTRPKVFARWGDWHLETSRGADVRQHLDAMAAVEACSAKTLHGAAFLSEPRNRAFLEWLLVSDGISESQSNLTLKVVKGEGEGGTFGDAVFIGAGILVILLLVMLILWQAGIFSFIFSRLVYGDEKEEKPERQRTGPRGGAPPAQLARVRRELKRDEPPKDEPAEKPAKKKEAPKPPKKAAKKPVAKPKSKGGD